MVVVVNTETCCNIYVFKMIVQYVLLEQSLDK